MVELMKNLNISSVKVVLVQRHVKLLVHVTVDIGMDE